MLRGHPNASTREVMRGKYSTGWQKTEVLFRFSTVCGGGAGLGGAIFNEGRLFVANVTFSGNLAVGGFGGSGDVNPSTGGGGGGGAAGGAVFNNGLLCMGAGNTFAGNRVIPGEGGRGNPGQDGSAAGPDVYDGPGGSQNCTSFTPTPTATNTPTDTPTDTPTATPPGTPQATGTPTPAPLTFLPALTR
jgi:hypothetical protein